MPTPTTMKNNKIPVLRMTFSLFAGAVILTLPTVVVRAQTGNVLNVKITGTGTVSSGQPSANSIQCPGQCSLVGFDNVVLTPKAAAGYYFAGWFNADTCAETGPCTVSLATGNQNVTAAFLPQDGATGCASNAMLSCFDQCTDPLTLQVCIIGCSAARNSSAQECQDNCFGDYTCLNLCNATVRITKSCAYNSGQVAATCGALVLNRATQVWQQTVRITNNASAGTLTGAAFVLDSLAAGWTLTNSDGLTTTALPPSGSPYKSLGPLAPGASTNIILTFSRTGTPAFSYVTRVTGIEQ